MITTYQDQAEKRIAEAEARAAELPPHLRMAHLAGRLKTIVRIFACVADAERRPDADAKHTPLDRAMDTLEEALADDFGDGRLAHLVEILLNAFDNRSNPVAWAAKGLNMRRPVSQLVPLLEAACQNDGYGPADGPSEAAEELRLFDRTEARAINEGLRRAA